MEEKNSIMNWVLFLWMVFNIVNLNRFLKMDLSSRRMFSEKNPKDLGTSRGNAYATPLSPELHQRSNKYN